MKSKSKLDKLERAAAASIPEKPFLILYQSDDDEDLFLGEGGEYSRPELEEMQEHYQIILVTYARDWAKFSRGNP